MTLTVVSDLNGASPQFTLTCISTGGPATTVTWTRDSVTITEGTETVLNDPVTAQYTHTLTITSEGEYTCTVANDKPSNASATITVPGIYNTLCQVNQAPSVLKQSHYYNMTFELFHDLCACIYTVE